LVFIITTKNEKNVYYTFLFEEIKTGDKYNVSIDFMTVESCTEILSVFVGLSLIKFVRHASL